MEPVQKTEAESVAAIVKAGLTPHHYSSRFGVVVMPNGQKINLEDERLDSSPKRKRASVSLIETLSFVAYVNAHKLPGVTHLFGIASESGGEFEAIIDYHGTQDGGSPATIGWGDHNATLTLATTPEWRRWIAMNEKLMPQETFAEFIENNMTDIVKPDAGILIDTAQMLQGTKSVTFKAGKNLKNGAITLNYSEVINTTGGTRDDAMQVPDRFTLGIHPFVGAEAIEVEARLRFRIGNDGKVTFAYVLERPFKVIEAAFILAREVIEEKTGLRVHLGTGQVNNPQTY
jgi:uncharacterized protein YfdQ (DUF2303 family)